MRVRAMFCTYFVIIASIAYVSIGMQLTDVTDWGHRCNELSAEKRVHFNCNLASNCDINCALLPSCTTGAWIHRGSSYFLTEAYGTNERQWVENNGSHSALRMQNISPYSLGVYECWCDAPSLTKAELVRCFHLMTPVYAHIITNGKTEMHSGSCYHIPMVHLVNVCEDDLIEVKCQTTAKLTTNCSKSSETEGSFRASPLQSPCKILCRIRLNDSVDCVVDVTLTVEKTQRNVPSHLETESPPASKPQTPSKVKPSLDNIPEVENGNPPQSNVTLSTFSLVIIIFLMIVVLVLLGILLCKNTSTRSKSVLWESSNRPNDLTGYTNRQNRTVRSRFQPAFVLSKDTSMLASPGTSTTTQSNAGVLEPRMITPYAITSIVLDKESLTGQNHLSNIQKIPENENSHRRMEARTFRNSFSKYINNETVIYAYD